MDEEPIFEQYEEFVEYYRAKATQRFLLDEELKQYMPFAFSTPFNGNGFHYNLIADAEVEYVVEYLYTLREVAMHYTTLDTVDEWMRYKFTSVIYPS